MVEPKPGQQIGRIGLPGKRERPRSPEILDALAAEKAKLKSTSSEEIPVREATHSEPEIAQAKPTRTPMEQQSPENPQIADEVVNSPSETPVQMLEQDSTQPKESGGGDKDEDLTKRGGMLKP